MLARLAQAGGVPSLSIAAWRLGFAAIAVTPAALWMLARGDRDAGTTVSRRQIGLALAAGLALALHFGTWISSLEVHLGGLIDGAGHHQPAVDRAGQFALFGERPGRAMLAGIVLSLGGSFLIFLSDSRQGRQRSLTPAGQRTGTGRLAVLSAYLMIGRRLRCRADTVAFVLSGSPMASPRCSCSPAPVPCTRRWRLRHRRLAGAARHGRSARN